MENNYYVYSHMDLDGKCFYIGKGSGGRYKNGSSRGSNWDEKTKEGFRYKILVSNLTNDKALELESSFIDQIGINNLVNVKNGVGKGNPINNYTNFARFKVIGDGKKYSSSQIAGKSLGITRQAIEKRINSENYPNWERVE